MLNLSEIEGVVAELTPRLVGGQVQKVREPDGATVVLSVRVPGQTTHLVLSATPGAVRIAESPSATPTRPAPSALGGWLRANLKGRRLESVRQAPEDRIVLLGFEAGQLVACLTGRSAELLGVDVDGRIVATARGVVAPGGQWALPDPPGRRAEAVRWSTALEVEAEAQRRLGERADQASEVEVSRLLRRAEKRLRRLQANVAQDLERCANADRDRHLGELLKSHQHAFSRGDASVMVTDWFAEGLPQVEVPLDPKLDPAGNVQKYFTRYRKAQAGLVRAQARQAEIEALAERFAALVDGAHAVEVLQEKLQRMRLLRPEQVHGKRAVTGPRMPFREWVNGRGDVIRVGRGGADNHALTFRYARGNDVWLHVRDCPGAHVVVAGPDVHQETLLDAAALAAAHSDLRDEDVVEVTWTLRKHLRAVKGAPGRVTVAGGKTVSVRPGARMGGLRRV